MPEVKMTPEKLRELAVAEDPNAEMAFAFANWRKAEDKVRALKSSRANFLSAIDLEIKIQETLEADARIDVEKIMVKNGVREDILQGDDWDYKITLALPPETVSVADESAIPEKFVEKKTETKIKKTETKIKKRELLEHLKNLRNKNLALPNYATIERGARQARWKAIKK